MAIFTFCRVTHGDPPDLNYAETLGSPDRLQAPALYFVEQRARSARYVSRAWASLREATLAAWALPVREVDRLTAVTWVRPHGCVAEGVDPANRGDRGPSVRARIRTRRRSRWVFWRLGASP